MFYCRYSILQEATSRETKKNGIIPIVHQSKPDIPDAPIEVSVEKPKGKVFFSGIDVQYCYKFSVFC